MNANPLSKNVPSFLLFHSLFSVIPSRSFSVCSLFFSLQPSFLRGSLVLMVIYQVVSSFSILSFTSLFFSYQSHNMIFTGLSGLIGYLPSCKLILYPLLHFTLFFSILLFLLVSLLFILIFLSFFHINITT